MDASDIFHGEYIFDEKVMGLVISQEIQETFLRTTPIYFRGCAQFPDVSQLLCTQLSSTKHVRDLIRYLRVYIYYEHFLHEKKNAASQPAFLPRYALFTESQLELAMYEHNRARLNALEKFPFKNIRSSLRFASSIMGSVGMGVILRQE
jgi:hypothetical protein